MHRSSRFARLLLIGALLVLLLSTPVATLAQAPAAASVGAFIPPVAAGATPAYALPVPPLRILPAPLQQAATDVVISEFRSRGPAGAAYPLADADEFIELFNPTAGAISINNWSVWKSDCDGTESLVLTFTGVTLQAGEHYLVGGLDYLGSPDLPAQDIGLDDNGGLALRSGPLLSDPIIDAVGMCDSAGYKETTALAPMVGDLDRSYDRSPEIGGLCTDSQNNAADFFLRTPSDPQNSSDPLTACGNPTATPTITPTHTPTATPTNTPACITPGTYPALSVIINEVGWAGTGASLSDDWLELYNPSSACTVDLEGWHLIAVRNITGGTTTAFDLEFDSSDDIAPGDYFVITRNTVSYDVFQNVSVDRDLGDSGRDVATGTWGLIEAGMTLYLRGPGTELVDSANLTIGSSTVSAWPAGSSSGRRSMERYRHTSETRANWVTFVGSTAFPDWPRGRDGNNVNGTPGRANWALTVTVTPSPVPTRFRTPTPRPPTPFPHMVINEFLPRAGTDWNQDGSVNVYDEFIELKNLGPINADLNGWRLDDAADQGAPPYSLPAVTLKPGERLVFYGLSTRILLEDSGDTVRLINTAGIVVDARSYGVVEEMDVSHCRIPDGYYWKLACFATPGNENALTGVAPAPAPIMLGARPPCLLPDTAPPPFWDAECEGYGDDIWDRFFWDEPPVRPVTVQGRHMKWKTSVE